MSFRVPRISAAAAGAIAFGLAGVSAALLRLPPPAIAAAAGLALVSGWVARRPARRNRRPRADEIRSLVYGTLGMGLALVAAVLAVLPVARALLRF